jgi:hypothetical protein
MSFDETFRFQPKIEEKEVYELTGEARELRELQPSHFEGPVAEWANERMNSLGETIVPRFVYIDQLPDEQHRVAWVYHDGINMENAESFKIHHVACDCSGAVDRAETQEEKQEILGNCQSLLRVLDRRAALINAAYGMDNVFDTLYNSDEPAEEQNSKAQHFAIRSMVYMLEHDYRHPESWMANVESGWMLINLMARVMHLRVEDVQWYAELLESQEIVETDGVAVSLSQDLKDQIEADKFIREATASFEDRQAA